MKIIYQLTIVVCLFFAYSTFVQAESLLSWSDENVEDLYDSAKYVYDAEMSRFTCKYNNPIPLEDCKKDLRPTTEIDCTGVFRVIARIKGDVELDQYFHIPFKSISSYSPACPIDVHRHLFLKEYERVRIYQSNELKFVFLEPIADITFLTLPSSERVPITKKFPDINDDKCAKLFNYFYWRGAVKGFNDGTARPYQPVSRAEFLTILTKTLSLQEAAEEAKSRFINAKIIDSADGKIEVGSTGAVAFPDVTGIDWFVSYVALGYENKWINGYLDGYFKPHNSISFVEALKIALKAFDIPIIKSDNDTKLPWYEPYLRTARKIGGIELLDNNKIISRCEVLTLIESVEREYLRINNPDK